jgi:hypothetical protein
MITGTGVTPLVHWGELPIARTSLSGLVKRVGGAILTAILILSPLLLLTLSQPANASIAWGSINNFDAVNDTGVDCHGFEIEIDDIHSTDISYTYDCNHYGVPRISEDNSDPLHPRVFVRYESAKNPDGTWAAFTSVPAAPILPTDGHQFTNPSVNFGGEHFGVGFMGTPTAVKYNWLKDDGAGNLIYAGAVNIGTPSFTYIPPAAVPAQVIAAIVLPPPPAPPILEFGDASWVKEIKTSSHNPNRVLLRDLVSDDPNDPNDRNWQNGEAAEVEIEWRILQTRYGAADGGPNGELAGAPEDLPGGDEVITRRYDFFKYDGPIDAETGEAMGDTVGPDGIHGVGVVTYADYFDFENGEWHTTTVNLSTVVVVGDYSGAQMAGFDAAAKIGLIDHLQDGETNLPYVGRTIVIGGTDPITTTRTGPLPDGMSFDETSGVLSGTPTVSGAFTFTIHSTDSDLGDVQHTYTLSILDPGVQPPPHINVTTSASPPEGGSTAGDGDYATGTIVTVVATANPGFAFVNWTDGGTIVSTSPSYDFTADVNRDLIANFVHTIADCKQQPNGTLVSPGGIVTQVSGGFFYIEDKNRISGIRVVQSPNARQVDDKMDANNLKGTMNTLPSGERCIMLSQLDWSVGYDHVSPVGVTNRAVGGGNIGDVAGGTGQTGITGGTGLNNIGLLIRTWGKVVGLEPVQTPTWFKIDDGSGVSLKVMVPPQAGAPALHAYVKVSGVSSCEKDNNGNIQRLILTRDSNDVQ